MKHVFHAAQILGSQRIPSSGAGHAAVNPATGETLEPVFHDATFEEIDRALRLAWSAHLAWKKRPLASRSALLDLVARELESVADDLVERGIAETGLPEARLRNELGRTTAQLRLFARHVEDGRLIESRSVAAAPDRVPTPAPALVLAMRPLGPVAVFGAGNFPLAFSVAGGDTASAFAAGCPVIVKAHPHHPGLSEIAGEAVARAVHESGLPEGVFGLIHGASPNVARDLVQHPLLAAVAFTGSTAAGLAIRDLAERRPTPIPVFAEMGSQNPVFILPARLRARGAETARELAAAITLGVGQFCTRPSLVVVQQGQACDRFVAELIQALDAQGGGVMLNPTCRDRFLAATAALNGAKGVQRLLEPSAEPRTCAVGPALFRSPLEAWASASVRDEEIFGPSSWIVTVEDTEGFLRLAGRLPGQLTAAIHGDEDDLSLMRDLLTLLEEKAGRLVFDGYPTGVEVNEAMMHGGPFPATTDSRFTSVGTLAVRRFLRPVCYQNLPPALRGHAERPNDPVWE
ncbi:MAG TPA: aldehyde dehydrogenase (NADP(+)) [Planctomycetes bacterium]|nr:aldehyde dehydrogenase (NADP(+)) [Planctomycetota bacterium]